MHKPESVLENEMRVILWDFVIQTITRQKIIFSDNKKLQLSSGFWHSGQTLKKKKKEIKKVDTYLDLARELKTLTLISSVIGVRGTISKGLEREWKN